jgi:activator of HSP90 ATPase
VSVNVRKGRIRQIFDLTMELEVAIEGDNATVQATITDYMSDTDYQSFEFNCSHKLPTLKKAIWVALEKFKGEVEELHGKPLLTSSTAANANVQPTDFAVKTEAANAEGVLRQENINVSSSTSSASSSSSSSSKGSIDESIIIAAPVDQVWACLTDPQRITAWTRGTARLNSFEPGASFSLLNGSILGTVTQMKESEHILRMDWRLKYWDSSCISVVNITLRSAGNQTTVKLKQTGIPPGDVDSLRENWHRYYWEPIKTLLGCASMGIF